MWTNSAVPDKTALELCNAKDSHILSTKNNSVFAYIVGIYLSCGLNDDVMLTNFLTTGPRTIVCQASFFDTVMSIVSCACLHYSKGPLSYYSPTFFFTVSLKYWRSYLKCLKILHICKICILHTFLVFSST